MRVRFPRRDLDPDVLGKVLGGRVNITHRGRYTDVVVHGPVTEEQIRHAVEANEHVSTFKQVKVVPYGPKGDPGKDASPRVAFWWGILGGAVSSVIWRAVEHLL